MEITNQSAPSGDVNFGDAFAVLEDAVDGFVACDSECRIISWNSAARQLCAKIEPGVTGVKPWDAAADLGGVALEQEIRRVLRDRAPGTLEYYHDRLACWLEVRVSAAAWHGASLWFRDVTQRKQFEEALRAKADELRQAQRLAGVGSWTMDLESRTLTWSEELYRMNARDMTRTAPTFEELGSLYTDQSWQNLSEAVERTIRDGMPYELEVEVVRPDGKNGWRIVRGEAQRDASGRTVKLRGTSQDITARKQGEEKLRVALAELSAIHAHAPMVFLMVDEDLRVRKVNHAAARLAGRDEADMLGLRPGGSLGCLNAAKGPNGCGSGPTCGQCVLRAAILDSIRGEVRHDNIEAWLPVQGSNGPEERCFLLFTAPLHISSQREVLVCAVDITDRKSAEKALRDSEFWMNESQRISRVGSYVLDCTKGIWTSSKTLDDIFGIPPDYTRTVGGWQALVHPEHRDIMTRHLEDEVFGQRKLFDHEYKIVRPADGRVRWVHGRGALVCDSEGLPTVMAGTIQDITSRRAVEEELMQAQKLEGLGRLAGGIAHDFNNLLTVINGYADMMLRGPLNESWRESAGEIRRAGERATGLTQQLLTFSRKQIIEPQVLDLNQLVGDNLDMLRRLMGEDIEVGTELEPKLGLVAADPGQLHQVLMNLVVNARDAMPRGGKLLIATCNAEVGAEALAPLHALAPGNYVVLSVTDNGPGIPDDVREHIFDPFFTTKGKAGGTGLGLATVHGIVQQAGGAISCESECGSDDHGTTFLIHLPRTEAATAELRDEARPSADLRGTETVFVVEDQDPVRRLAVRLLSDCGYRILEAANGEEALAQVASYAEPIDLLLTDVIMPRMTGRELADRLTLARPGMKVLYMSGYAEDVIASRGLLDPGLFFVAKPFTLESLALKVREVLGNAPAQALTRVLVVDDESGVRALFRAILADEGYDVTVAADGSEALRLVRRDAFDLVLTDLVMPDKEGIEVIRTIRRERPDLKIIAMSGAFGGEFLQMAKLLGANGTLVKPVAAEELVAAIRSVLE